MNSSETCDLLSLMRFAALPDAVRMRYLALCQLADDEGRVEVDESEEEPTSYVSRLVELGYAHFVEREKERTKERDKDTDSLIEREYISPKSNKKIIYLHTKLYLLLQNRDSSVFVDKSQTNHQKTFKPPSVEEVIAYVSEKGYSFDPEEFHAFYESKGWYIGKTKMKSWKAACVTWEKDAAKRRSHGGPDRKTKEANRAIADQLRQHGNMLVNNRRADEPGAARDNR